MTWEYSRIFLKVILVLENLSEVCFLDLKTDFWMFQVHILDLNVHIWLSHSLKLDLNVCFWRSHRILLDLDAHTEL